MSVARGFGLNGKSFYTNVCKPLSVWCNFIVDAANGNGLGMRSLKSNGYIETVFMHTSTTPGKSPGGLLNPNPDVGYANIVFKNNFNYYLGGFSGQIITPGSPTTTSTTNHSPFVITSLGTATLAQWQAAGVPQGVTPAVGVAFIAIATGTIGGSATVGVPGVQIAPIVSVFGDPNQSLNNSNIASNSGARIVLQFSGPTNSSTTTLVATNPADNSVVGLNFNFDGSSVTIDGL